MYYDLVSRMHHDANTTISTVAVGTEANVDLLQSIAKYGGGSYYQTDSASNLPQLFVEDFKAHGGEITMVEKEFTPRTASPDAILKDLASRQMPPLKGYVSTEIKPRATMDMYVDRADTHEPVIASWKYGAGKVMAVTTDASGRWSGTWVTANLFAAAVGSPARVDDAGDAGRAEDRRRARLQCWAHQYQAHRLQRRARQCGAPGDRAGDAARRYQDRNRADRRSRRRAVGIDRRARARQLLLRGALAGRQGQKISAARVHRQSVASTPNCRAPSRTTACSKSSRQQPAGVSILRRRKSRPSARRSSAASR